MAEPIEYADCPEAMKIAGELIQKYHPHLIPFALRIVTRSKSRNIGKCSRGGKVTALGTAEILSGRTAFYAMTPEEIETQAQYFEDPYKIFWMELSGEYWPELEEKQRLALIDHELCHFGVEIDEDSDEPKLFIIRHDIEEFEDIVRRHGIYRPDLESFAAALMGMEGA